MTNEETSHTLPKGWTFVEAEYEGRDLSYYLHTSGDSLTTDDEYTLLWDHFTEDSERIYDISVYEAMEKYNEGAYT